MYLFIRLLFLTTVLLSPKVFAVAFDSCPSKAYLFQGKPVSVYGINLVTGTNSLLQDDTGLPSNINGVGFNEVNSVVLNDLDIQKIFQFCLIHYLTYDLTVLNNQFPVGHISEFIVMGNNDKGLPHFIS